MSAAAAVAGTSAPVLRGFPDLGRARVLGVLNVTPDSFSDGGRWLLADDAIRHGRRLVADGADLVDVGGESTRPGAARVSAQEELARVLPVVRALAGDGIAVSIDTSRAEVAAKALDAGAVLVNDVSGGTADPALPALVAERGCPYVVMHTRGTSADMASRAHYADVVGDVVAELAERLAAVRAAGVHDEQVIVDPGLGFAKEPAHNWALLGHLDALAPLGRPVLVGASRKSFLGTLLAGPDGAPRPVEDREAAGVAVGALAAAAGVWGVRVHDPRPTADALRVAAAWNRGGAR
jgi:dihydropteroate synthase